MTYEGEDVYSDDEGDASDCGDCAGRWHSACEFAVEPEFGWWYCCCGKGIDR